MLSDSQDWWAKQEWTDEHYKLARELMRTIRVLPQDWSDDIIQEVAMRYEKAKSTGRGGDYRAWLRTTLCHKAIDVYRKERHIRMKEENRPIFVSLESIR
ncbi:MAG: hypothetical protein DMG97_01370 [Acidobacteria bacterium]|nr:MAG: hypothetical protein DMG96_27665 [Acidobacteriota bacterium]PYV77589.1 MAG: hypothetical protein DMG97_01370 [Acidobacteriota bacterium]